MNVFLMQLRCLLYLCSLKNMFRRYVNKMKEFRLFFCIVLFFLSTGNAQPLNAKHDYFQVLTCAPSTILDVFANDAMIPCTRSEIQLTISGGSKIGATTSVNGDKNIVYAYPTGFSSRDTLEYTVVCKSVVYKANVFITVVKCPDNIEDAECFGEPEGFLWDIKEDWRSTQTNISTYISPMVADLNDDGIPEILVGRFNRDVGSDRIYDGIYIYWGHDRANPTFMPSVEGLFAGYGFSVAKVKIGGIIKPIIVIVGHADGCLYAYDPTKTTEPAARIWKSSHPLDNSFNSVYQDRYTISFADFDGDGEVEVFARGRIYDASTGTLLLEVPAGGNMGYSWSPCYASNMYKMYCPIAADVNNDGKLEYIAGTEVYSVNIINQTGTAGNKMQLIASIPAVDLGGGQLAKDGTTVVADINGDGRLDVVVRVIGNTTPFNYGIFAWDVQTQSLIAKSAWISSYDWAGFPLIGNIDNEPNLEILLTTNTSNTVGRIDGFRWDGNQTFNRIYTYNTSDRSGGTGITLFDFNEDDVMELVYRDETHLRIMKANPGAGTFTDLKTFPATSGTAQEYPVVADVDNDGSAEIAVVGGTAASATQGSLRIYKSGNQYLWTSARKVWNQYAYNVVNVNEDLTIPRFQMSPATIFPNGKQPFNAFLQQQTMLNTNGDSYMSMPNIIFTSFPQIISNCDSIVFTGCIKNVGDAPLQAPFYVTFYKNDTTNANIIALKSVSSTLKVDGVYCFRFTLHNLENFAPFTSIWLSINDNNGNYPYQPQCEVDGRRKLVVKSCDNFAEFYANEVHYTVLQDTTFCSKKVDFRAEIEGVYTSLKWYINGTEVPNTQDQLSWSISLESDKYEIKMWVLFDDGETEIFSDLYIKTLWIMIRNVRE